MTKLGALIFTELVNLLSEGKIILHVFKVYSLAESAQSHNDLEFQKSSGKLVLEFQKGVAKEPL